MISALYGIRELRRDNGHAIRASRIRKYARLNFYHVRNCVQPMTMLLVIGLALAAQAHA